MPIFGHKLNFIQYDFLLFNMPAMNMYISFSKFGDRKTTMF